MSAAMFAFAIPRARRPWSNSCDSRWRYETSESRYAEPERPIEDGSLAVQ
jgi:hypothetical protein